jgi:DNA-binding CsgD family transcriptional regulator
MQRAIECQGESLTLGAIEALGVAAFLLDRLGRVATISPEGEIALRQGTLRLDGGRLAGRTTLDDGLLRTAVNRALRGLPQLSERLWLSPREDVLDRSWCEVYPLPRREWATLFRPHVLVTVNRTKLLASSDTQMLALRQLLQLTPSEADIAIRLANGESRGDIAESRQTSVGTVSIQLKNIFQKSRTHREGELISLINRLIGG